ncbi:MAG: hypothetical protein RSD88_03640 [Anaerovoracaceae bacterium]
MSSKKQGFFLGMGVISLVVVLIILTISCFAILTYISADTEYQLSQKTKASVDGFYKADSEANLKMAEISREIKKGKLNQLVEEKRYVVTSKGNTQIISFDIKVGREKILKVKAGFTPEGKGDVYKWQILQKH